MGSSWPAVAQEPITYIVLLRHETPPRMQDVIQMLSATAARAAGDEHADFSVVDEPVIDEASVWTALIAGPTWSSPIVVWAEPARPLPKETVDALGIADCRWAIGIQTLLPLEQPHVHQHRLLRIIGRAFADSPAVLNAFTGGWHTREELDTVLLPAEVEVGPALLFMVHAIAGNQQEGEPQPRMFAYTLGLHTAGRAELEMHGIDPQDGRAAAALLTGIAERLVEEDLPEPGEPFEVGTNHYVRLFPAGQAAAESNPSWIGSAAQRLDHEGRQLSGERIAVCAVDAMTWPVDAGRALINGSAAMYRTRATTERDARIARRTLDHFIGMCQKVPEASRSASPGRVAAFLVKAGFAVLADAAAGEDHREHLWFEVVKIRNGRVRGKLLHEPAHIQLREGDLAWIDRALVSDWQVMTSKGQFGPAQHAAARQTIEQIIAEAKHGER